MSYEDILYEVQGTTAVITINRPQRYNAFRGRTVEELIGALRTAWADRAVRVVVVTGAGDKAFSTGGDVKQRAETGDYGPTESGLFEIDALHRLIREIPKPVIAAVNGLVVPAAELMTEALSWAADIAKMSPTAIKFLKHSFDTDTEQQAAVANLAGAGLALFVESEEGREGARAFAEKRAPDFSGYAAV